VRIIIIYIGLLAIFGIQTRLLGQQASEKKTVSTEQLVSDLALANVDTLKFQLLDQLIRKLMYTDLAKSRFYAEELMRQSQISRNELWIANGKNNFSKILVGQGKVDSAIIFSQQAIATYEKLGNTRMKNAARLNLGVMYIRQGNTEKGLEIHFKLLDEIASFNNAVTVAAIYGNIASIYLDLGELEKANEYDRKALEWAKKSKTSQKIADILSHLAQNLSLQKDSIDASIRLLKEAIDLQNVQKTCLSCLGRDNLLLSQLFLSKKEMNLARNTAQKGVDFSRKSGEQLLFFENSAHAAKLFSINQNLMEASLLLKEAEKIKPTIKSADLLAKFFEAKAEFEYAIGNQLVAFENRQVAQAFQDSSQRQRFSEKVFKLGLQNDLKLQAKQTEILKTTNEHLTEKNRYSLLLVGLFSLMLIGVAIFVRHIRIQKMLIENQRNQLQKLNATKDKFFAIIAHDLRGPIVSFHGLIKKINWLIARGETDRVAQLGASVDEAAAGLNKLLDNLLAWALIQRGTMPYHPELIRLREEAEAGTAAFRNSLTIKQIDIDIDISETMEVFADRNALACFLRNLTDNALKYSPEGSQIQISAKPTESQICLSIADNGPGMDVSQIDRLLSETNPENNAIASKGTGLGLMLCRELANINKGKLEVVSHLGKGTVISIYLPKAA
jgi:signal transduction histidine kinase